MGSRGSGGPSLADGVGGSINIVSEQDVWSYRHRPENEPFVDAINNGAHRVQKDFPDLMDLVEVVSASELGGADKTQTLGYYDDTSKTVAVNRNYTDIAKMNQVYDKAVADEYHPSRGNLTGTEAVALHELGHALTDYAAKKMGAKSFDAAAKRIVKAAYKANGGQHGTLAWARNISVYAQKSNAECIAEAVADYYCNGDKASSQSQAIMRELMKYR